MKATARKLAIPVAFLAIGLPVGIWAVTQMGDSTAAEKAADKAAFRSVSTQASGRSDRRAEARWEPVKSVTGTGPSDVSFAISKGAIQWKADWRCQSGKLEVRTGSAVADSACPRSGAKTFSGDKGGRIHVEASGPWRIAVSQQVDTALEEPPLPGMDDSAVLARGRFHSIEKRGEGTASLYRLPGGRLALRFNDFYTGPSPGLQVWLSRAKDPDSTLDARRAKYVNAGPIKSTFGSYNQLLPKGVQADQIDSIVVWCPAVLIAFTAAPLG